MMPSDSQEFHLKIRTGNAAFDHYDVYLEVARLLKVAAEKFEDMQTQGMLHDINGNNVGYFIWSGRSE